MPYGSCAAVPRLFQPRKRPEPVGLGLMFFCLLRPRRPFLWRDHGPTRLEIIAVDRAGRAMTGRTAELSVVGARPSAVGGGLLDVTVSGEVEEQPRPELEAVWACAARWEKHSAVPAPPTQVGTVSAPRCSSGRWR